MAHRLPPQIVSELTEALDAAGLVRSSFGSDKPITVTTGSTSTDYPSVTEFIKEKVRLHHSSWIIRPIQRVLNWSQSTDDGSMSEYTLLGRLRAKFPNPAVLEEAAREIEALQSENAVLRRWHAEITKANASADADLKEIRS